MLIGITGQKGSGKDTFAGNIPAKHLKMADTLKNMLRTLYREAALDEATIERKIEGDLKEEPCGILGGATPRRAMQTLGTEWAKMVDPSHELWSRIWFGKANQFLEEGCPVVCTDVRFAHEAAAIEGLGGYLVRVERPGQEGGDPHISETEMANLPVDFTVLNNGSIEELEAKAAELIKDIYL